MCSLNTKHDNPRINSGGNIWMEGYEGTHITEAHINQQYTNGQATVEAQGAVES